MPTDLRFGRLRRRNTVVEALLRLRQATDAETLHFIDRHTLSGRGVGYVDVHLLASVQLTANARFWTSDKRLHRVAEDLGLAMAPP